MDKSKDGMPTPEQEAIDPELQLPLMKFFNSQFEATEGPHIRQEEVNELAETDRDAAVALAREIRTEEEAKSRKRAERKTLEQEAAEARKAKATEARLEVASNLEALGQAQSIDAFLDAAERLQVQQRQEKLLPNDLSMYAAKRDLMAEKVGWNALQLRRMKRLQELNDVADLQQKYNQAPQAEPAGFFRVDGGALRRQASGEKGTHASAAAPKAPPVAPPTFWDNARALFGIKPKK